MHQAGTKGITPRDPSLYTGDYKHGTQDLRTQETENLRTQSLEGCVAL